MTSKTDLRKYLRQSRHNFVLQHNLSQIEPQNIVAKPLLELINNATCLAGYHDVKGEPSVLGLMRFAGQASVKTALPRVEVAADSDDLKKGDIRFLKWVPDDPLERSPLGFMQPFPRSPEIDPDIILTPLLGFDRGLNRLGQGAGHYDRAFARWPAAIRIGIAWSIQEHADIPTDPWDIPLHAVLTEREWISRPSTNPMEVK